MIKLHNWSSPLPQSLSYTIYTTHCSRNLSVSMKISASSSLFLSFALFLVLFTFFPSHCLSLISQRNRVVLQEYASYTPSFIGRYSYCKYHGWHTRVIQTEISFHSQASHPGLHVHACMFCTSGACNWTLHDYGFWVLSPAVAAAVAGQFVPWGGQTFRKIRIKLSRWK